MAKADIASLSRLDSIDAQIAQLMAKRKVILAREKDKARRARTKRLIEYGAIAEGFFDFHGSPEEFKLWLDSSVEIKSPFQPEDPAVLEREIQRWMGFIRDNFTKRGYAYEKGISRIKELGAYERFQDEIEAIIAQAKVKR
jgi:hypothetical protein